MRGPTGRKSTYPKGIVTDHTTDSERAVRMTTSITTSVHVSPEQLNQ